jgi:hypothetical protein
MAWGREGFGDIFDSKPLQKARLQGIQTEKMHFLRVDVQLFTLL